MCFVLLIRLTLQKKKVVFYRYIVCLHAKNNIIMPIYILKLYRYIYTYKSMTKNSMCMCKTNKRQKI